MGTLSKRGRLHGRTGLRTWSLGGVVAAVVLFIGAVAIAGGYLLINQGDYAEVDEAVYRAYNPTTASGSGVFDTFVQIGGNTEQTKGYNSNWRPSQFDMGNSKTHNHAILLSEIPIVTDPLNPGILYREVQLDINQVAGDMITLDQVEMYLTLDDELHDYPFGGEANSVYELDKPGGDNNWIQMNYDLAPGSGKRDMILRVPNSNFLADPLGQDPNCAYKGIGCLTYFVLYSEFGADDEGKYPNTDGFEEWGVELYELASKSGTKFHDLNANGIRDLLEPGLEGWTIYVDMNNNGALDLGEPYDVTDVDGAYLIENIFEGIYKVREVAQSGWTCSFPTDADAFGCYYEEVFEFDTDYTGNDFGNFENVDVTACKVEDLDGDLSTVGDQSPIAGWMVYLSIEGVRQTPGQPTGEDGCYTWTGLVPGVSYDVEEDDPAPEWTALTPLSHDFGPAVSGGDYSFTFANFENVDVTACKYEDYDGDGGKDLAIVGWEVYLTIDGVIQDTQVTGENGCYTWMDLGPLAAGSYYDIGEELVPGWTPTSPTVYLFESPPQSGASYTGDFTNFENVDVTACKYEDYDGDGGKDLAIVGWEVYLTIDGVIQDTQVTGENGCYTWMDLGPLAAGSYYDIGEELVPGWTPTSPTVYLFESPPQSGASYTGDFTNFENVDVTACKYEDYDGDGGKDLAIVGWEVYLTIDGVIQDTQVTGENGCYTWMDLGPLAAGSYYDIGEELVPGWTPTSPTVYLFESPPQSGASYTGDFTNFENVDVTACKYEDYDGDGGKDLAIVGWEVYLTIDGVIQDTQVTGENGCYTWMDLGPLAAGSYYDIGEELVPGWTPTSPTVYLFESPPQSGASYTGDFTNFENVDVTACKYEDYDGDGGKDLAIVGWEVYLTIDGVIQDTQVTGENGCYTWMDLGPLAAGSYYDIGEELVPGWTPTSPTVYLFESPPQSGASYTGDFTNFENVDVTACKEYDADGLGATTDDRTPIADWMVYLSIDGVRQTPGQPTGEDGCYTWTNLGPGVSYDVEEDLPTGWFALTATSHDFGPAVSGGDYSFTFVNSEYGYVEVLKYFNGLIDPTVSLTFNVYAGPDGFGGPVLASDNTFGATDGVLDFGGYELMPNEPYTICELDIPVGWTSVWMIGSTPITPYNPDAPVEDLGNRCYDFTVAPAETLRITIDNQAPGGDPRTPGYWKNWNLCTGGGQAATALANGGWAEGFWLLDDLIPITIGEFNVDLCEVGVDVLDGRDVKNPLVIKDGKKKSSDAAYQLARNLLAAKLNLGANAESCPAVLGAVAEGDAILTAIGYNGTGNYYKPNDKDPYRTTVLYWAGVLDVYNNGNLCP